eukprot:7251826-Pyramimonas_sp.AAC.1
MGLSRTTGRHHLQHSILCKSIREWAAATEECVAAHAAARARRAPAHAATLTPDPDLVLVRRHVEDVVGNCVDTSE